MPTQPADSATRDAYDVVVVGGSFSGAGFATLLRRWRPDCRLLVVERAAAFTHRAGEATVEMSSCFLHRVLRLNDHLAREHLPKHGLRYWFSDGGDRRLAEMTEVGPRELPRLPSFQLDRARLASNGVEASPSALEASGCQESFDAGALCSCRRGCSDR